MSLNKTIGGKKKYNVVLGNLYQKKSVERRKRERKKTRHGVTETALEIVPNESQ